MTGKPGIIAARHTWWEKDAVHIKKKIYYWLISEGMKDVDLQKGDIVRVHAKGMTMETALVYVVDLLHEVPTNGVQPTKYTIEKIKQHPPVLLDEPKETE